MLSTILQQTECFLQSPVPFLAEKSFPVRLRFHLNLAASQGKMHWDPMMCQRGHKNGEVIRAEEVENSRSFETTRRRKCCYYPATCNKVVLELKCQKHVGNLDY